MSHRVMLLKPYSAYEREPTPPEDALLTHVERGSPGGGYLRRFWQPVALSPHLRPHQIERSRHYRTEIKATRGGT